MFRSKNFFLIKKNVFNKIKLEVLFCILLILNTAYSQSISGNLSSLAGQKINLEGFDGLKTYYISSTNLDAKGNFKLSYSKADYGIGYLKSPNDNPLFVILSGEDIEITGKTLSYTEAIKVIKGKENQWFEQYAKEHPRREQALSAWIYLEKIYVSEHLFSAQKTPAHVINSEKLRIQKEDANFLANLAKNSYVSWFLPTRKLVSSVSVIAQQRTNEIPATLAAFRAMNYADPRLYKSGLLKDAIESHFWLIENSGRSLDSVFIEMRKSIDAMLVNLTNDEKKFNEVTNYLFDLLEKHSLFQASEYLALKVLNEVTCNINSDLAKQLESYRAMKKGNIAPEIDFGNKSFVNGLPQNQFSNLTSINSPYTLVVFGASWCPKCSNELPKLLQNYERWKNLGLEVVYISLDTESNTFEQAVKTYPFFAFCDFKKWDSPVVNDYFVSGTPTFYLLNNKREILLKPISISQMDAWVNTYLKSGQ